MCSTRTILLQTPFQLEERATLKGTCARVEPPVPASGCMVQLDRPIGFFDSFTVLNVLRVKARHAARKSYMPCLGHGEIAQGTSESSTIRTISEMARKWLRGI